RVNQGQLAERCAVGWIDDPVSATAAGAEPFAIDVKLEIGVSCHIRPPWPSSLEVDERESSYRADPSAGGCPVWPSRAVHPRGAPHRKRPGPRDFRPAC